MYLALAFIVVYASTEVCKQFKKVLFAKLASVAALHSEIHCSEWPQCGVQLWSSWLQGVSVPMTQELIPAARIASYRTSPDPSQDFWILVPMILPASPGMVQYGQCDQYT